MIIKFYIGIDLCAAGIEKNNDPKYNFSSHGNWIDKENFGISHLASTRICCEETPFNLMFFICVVLLQGG